MKKPRAGKIIAKCPEFVCIEYPDGRRVVESSPEVERALLRAQFGISSADEGDKRVDLANVSLGLAELAAGQEVDSKRLLEQLKIFLGKPIGKILSVTPVKQDQAGKEVLVDPSLLVSVPKQRQHALAKYSARISAEWAHSAQKQREKAIILADDLAADFKNALLALVRWKYPAQDRRSKQPEPVNLVWLVQHTAKQIFRENLIRPTKAQIREVLEEDGFGFKGKNREAQWRELFERAALGNLPDSEYKPFPVV